MKQVSLSIFLILAAAASASAQLPPPPAPPENPITPAKRVLGKILFWDEQLSSDNTVACGTCHIPAAGGGEARGEGVIHPGPDAILGTPDDVRGSPGVLRSDEENDFEPDVLFGWNPQVTGRQSPSFIGAQYAPLLFWDGRAASAFVDPQTSSTSIAAGGALESQAIGPPVSDVEMAHESRDWTEIVEKLEQVQPLKLATNLPPDVVTTLGQDPTYPDLFASAFGTPEINSERIAFAIATYERTLIADQTPFDAGNLTPQQQQGLNLFNLPGFACSICHVPPQFTNFTFRNIGVRPPPEDIGRQVVTGNPNDRGRFKVPSLRNVGLRNRFFHNGGFGTIEEVLDFYNRGGDFLNNQDPLIRPIGFGPVARAQLADFLRNGLTDPRVANELPPFDRPSLQSESPLPNPTIVGAGTPGSGGFTPLMIAISPPSVGTPGFKIGVAGGLGGARAILTTSSLGTFPMRGIGAVRGGIAMPGALGDLSDVVVLEGAGPGQGFTTRRVELTDPGLIGLSVRVRWLVRDPGAEGGFARSPAAILDFF